MPQNDMDVRHQASAILSVGKMRLLDEARIAVVSQDRLEALERVAQKAIVFAHRWSLKNTRAMFSQDQIDAYKKQCKQMERDLLAAVNALEAIDRGTGD